MVRRVQLSDQVEWPPKQRKRTTWTALGREFITMLCCFTWAVSSQPDSGRHPELPKCTVVGTRSRMARGCRCQRNSNLNNTQCCWRRVYGQGSRLACPNARRWRTPGRIAAVAGSVCAACRGADVLGRHGDDVGCRQLAAWIAGRRSRAASAAHRSRLCDVHTMTSRVHREEAHRQGA